MYLLVARRTIWAIQCQTGLQYSQCLSKQEILTLPVKYQTLGPTLPVSECVSESSTNHVCMFTKNKKQRKEKEDMGEEIHKTGASVLAETRAQIARRGARQPLP